MATRTSQTTSNIRHTTTTTHQLHPPPPRGMPLASRRVAPPPAGPGRLCSAPPASPRRLFRHISYPKRLTKTAASYLHNLQALLAAYVPWMTHLTLCVYHVWALIWALARPWSSPRARVSDKPLLYGLLLQHCFLVEAIDKRLGAHNWRGALAERVARRAVLAA